MSDEANLIECLELAGEACEDPTPLVYKNLFQKFPEIEGQFILDRDGSAKGQMLFQFIECILDLVGEKHFSAAFIQSEFVNHQGLGVEPHMFKSFFSIVRDTFREILGDKWTDGFESSWNKLIKDLDAIVEPLC